MNSRIVIFLFFVALIGLNAAQPSVFSTGQEPPSEESQWVDSIFNAMTPSERIAQLMMVRAHSNLGPDHVAKVEKIVKQYQVGGLCFFQGTPEKQAELTNRYQMLTRHVPLMIGMDAEWGLGMRFKEDGISFPRQLMLGAIQDNRLLYEMGKEVARQSKRLGVHVNFAPVADVNNNPENPVINTRSFGEDRYNVAAKCYMYMRGMQDHGLMACAKHFPGHGDTNVDSHYDLPIIPHDLNRLDSIEMFPFRLLSQHGIQSVMVAHLSVPAIDNTPNRPTSLSPKAVDDILRDQFGFEGLIFTDGLGMKGVSKHYKPGQTEAEALRAGNDVLLLPQDVPAALREIEAYLEAGKLDLEDINSRVKKVLRAKYRLGITRIKPIAIENIRAEINSPKALALKRELTRNALTMVRNSYDLVPFQALDSLNIASLSVGLTERTPFQQTLGNYTELTHYNTASEISSSRSKQLLRQLSEHDIVVVGLHKMSSSARKDFGISPKTRQFLNSLQKKTKVVLVVFGSPYSLRFFDSFEEVMMAYDEDDDTQDLAAQALFGAFGIDGRLPVTASPRSRFNQGVTTRHLFRLGYSLPEEVGMNGEVLAQIETLAKEAIRKRATPGCVVLVAKDGQVVYNQAFGHHTYRKLKRLQTSDLFDLASITKVAATTLSVMKLHDEGTLNVYEPMSRFLTALDSTNKADMTVQDVMAHRAQLKPWIPFYEQTITSSRRNPRPLSRYYHKKPTSQYSIPVTEKLYMRNDYTDVIRQQIYESDLLSKRRYKYSDLGFYLLSDMVEEQSGQPLDRYAAEQFYQKLGLASTTFNPWKNFPKSKIVPTEEDRYFRRQRIHGYVHDMGAAMLGGVSGHAGLFSNANDLAVLMQLLLNDGYYGGRRYLSAETVHQFTRRHAECTRRGVGFDLKELDQARSQNMGESAPTSTFGHLGFTGTCTWVDPDNNLIYIFLSNRTFPSMHNYKLNKEDYRPRIHNIIYESLGR